MNRANGVIPFFTVIMPLYNKRSVVTRAVFSVVQQTLENFELIIVDDGSTDGSVDELSQFERDSRVRVVSTENNGAATARNNGIKLARGEYVAFIDSDDEWDMCFLSCMHKLIRRYPEHCIFSSGYSEVSGVERVDRSVRVSQLDGNEATESFCIQASDYYKMLDGFGFSVNNSSTTVIKKSCLTCHNISFPAGQRYYEDHFVWYSLVSLNGMMYAPKNLVSIYKDAENRSNNSWTVRSAIDSLCSLKHRLDLFFQLKRSAIPDQLQRTISRRAEYIARASIRNGAFEDYKYIESVWTFRAFYRLARIKFFFDLYRSLAIAIRPVRRLFLSRSSAADSSDRLG